MVRRIGDELVGQGLVSTEQLNEALAQQAEAGGLLGASLLELGLIDEQTLGRTLAAQYRVRYAPPGMLRDIQEPAKRALPRRLLWKLRSVPFKLKGSTLHLLVANPRNLSGLSATTGYRIVPWLAPEVRVHRELQRHFRIPLSSRYAKIARRLDERSTEAPGTDAFAERLARADDADDAVDVVLNHLAGQLATCILFRVKDGEAAIWDLRGHVMHPPDRAGFKAPATSGNPLELLVIHPTYRGAVPDEPVYRKFFDRLGLPVPREIVLFPIEVAGKRVAILYGDGGPSAAIEAPQAEQVKLVRKLVLALTMVLIRHKIRQ